jgi:hypothetical protein
MNRHDRWLMYCVCATAIAQAVLLILKWFLAP